MARQPVKYSPEVASRICEHLRTGMTLRAVCRLPGMPTTRTVLDWQAEDVGGFRTQYASAREDGYHAMAEQIIEIADQSDGDVIKTADGKEVPNTEFIARSRLRTDARIWLLSKALPKIYGARQAIDHRFHDAAASEAGDEDLLAIARSGRKPSTPSK